MKNEYLEKIKELTREVRLPGVRKYLTEEINQANLKPFLKGIWSATGKRKEKWHQAGWIPLSEVLRGSLS